MQLDRTEIVIRQRSAVELFDLSLLTLRRHIKPIAITSCLLGIPLLVIDMLVVSWMVSDRSLLMASHLDSPEGAMRWRYNGHLMALYVMQFPLISLPTTVFLGNQIFFEHLNLWGVLKRLGPIAWRSLFVLGVVRLGFVGLALESTVDRDVAYDASAEFWILYAIPVIGLLVRAYAPFAPEVLGLERCKLRPKSELAIPYAKRSRSLHRPLAAEHVARFCAAIFFSVLLGLLLLGSALFVQGVTTGVWQWSGFFDYVMFPATLWLVGLFMTVFRFLSYLDSRIRLEGWEIELRLRAEADRLEAEMHPTLQGSQSIAKPQPATTEASR